MITSAEAPVSWALLVSALDDAREHLATLLAQIAANGEIADEEFSVQVGHVYAHLNRAWNSRHHTGELSRDEHSRFSHFPRDLEPVG